jgi:hypothetical protein
MGMDFIKYVILPVLCILPFFGVFYYLTLKLERPLFRVLVVIVFATTTLALVAFYLSDHHY